jgi:hypothetical protein
MSRDFLRVLGWCLMLAGIAWMVFGLITAFNGDGSGYSLIISPLIFLFGWIAILIYRKRNQTNTITGSTFAFGALTWIGLIVIIFIAILIVFLATL